jgi:hypothetical protein
MAFASQRLLSAYAYADIDRAQNDADDDAYFQRFKPPPMSYQAFQNKKGAVTVRYGWL